jgi:CheY-like chemotaxis protein
MIGIRILVCDDNARFASTIVDSLSRKLKIRHGLPENTVQISSCTQSGQILTELTTKKINLIFCDLGRGDMTLEGVQILKDAKLFNDR